MPSFTFQGFSTGDQVGLSILQSSNSIAKSVDTWGQGSLASLNILITTAPIVTAPAPVWVEAIELSGFDVPGGAGPNEVYDPSFHEITYIWTVQGAPLAPYTAPENMVSGWNNPNVAYGKKAAFCFPDPGTYTIELWAVDASGTTGIASTVISVANATSLYPADRTIAFAGDGNFSEAPSGAQQVSSVSALENAISAANHPLRVLFKRGQTVTNMRLRTSGGRLDHIGAFGTGSAPALRPIEYDTSDSIQWSSSGPETQITISGLKFEGFWDPTTETGSLGGSSPLNWKSRNTAAKILVHDCEITNCETWEISCNSVAQDVMIANCITRNWQQYGAHSYKNQAGKYAFLGCRAAQSPDALNGGPKKGLSNNHGPCRIENCGWVVMDVCDLFSNTGWSAGHDTQPCFRLSTAQTGTLGASAHVGRTVMENGSRVINLAGENAGAEDNPGNYVFDRLVLIGGAQANIDMIICHKGGTTFRNMLLFHPNVERYSDPGPQSFFNFAVNNHRNGNASEPVRIYNVTAISLLNGATEESGPMNLSNGASSFTNYTEENNVLHIPNGSVPATASAPIDMTSTVPGVTPRYKGVQYNYEHVTGTLSSNIPHGGTHTIPYSSLRISDHNGSGAGTETDQAYWTAIENTDTRHHFSVNGSVHYAANNDFTVSFGSTQVTLTNTSGATWSAGTNWWLALDRSSRLHSDLPLQTQYENPSTVPSGTPLAGSPAQGGGGLGLKSYNDFYGAVRASPASSGAIEP